MRMLNEKFRHLLSPMFSFVEDAPGGDATPPEDDPTPAADPEDPDKAPPPPAEDKEEVVEESEISDEEFDDLNGKMSPRQVAAMNKRMRDKIAKLEKERKEPPKAEPPTPKADEPPPKTPGAEKNFDPIAWLSDTDKGKAALAHIKRSGLDDDQIRAIIDIIGIASTRISGSAVEPIASEFREGKFAKALESFSKEDKNKFGMSKPEIRKAVESYIRQNYQPQEWNNPNTIKAAYGIALAEHPEIFTAGKREIVNDGADIHSPGTGGASSTGGVSNSALEAFAQERNLGDIKDQVVRKKVLEAYNLKKRIEAGSTK
jgi:hypothetical protein